MCGLVTMINKDATFDRKMMCTLSEMMAANTFRGSDSTGLAYGGWYQSEVYKRAVPGYDFVEQKTAKRVFLDWNDHQFILGHGRAATKGQITPQNAHPFVREHITGVHNGTVNNFHTLYKGQESFGTDSETIFAAIADEGAAAVIPKIDGAYVLQWFNSDDNTLHFIKNDQRSFCFIKLEGDATLLGASELQMAQWIATRNGLKVTGVIEPQPMIEYVWYLDDLDLYAPLEVEHEEYQFKQQYQNRGGSSGKTGAGNRVVNLTKNTEKRCGTTNNTGGTGTKRIDRPIMFLVTSWKAYNAVASGGDLGVFKGLATDGEEVKVYSQLETELELGGTYEGMTKSILSDVVPAYGVDPKSIKRLNDEDWVMQPNRGSAVVREIPWNTANQCINCERWFPDDDVVIYDNAPLCVDCIDQYEYKSDKAEETKDGA